MEKSDICFNGALLDYMRSVSLREHEVLRRLREETQRDPDAIMQITPEQGQFMALLVRLMRARKTLEIGTYTGYSALSVALALPADGRVVACDVSETWTNVGKRYWQEAGVADRIDLRLGPALDTLRELQADGHNESFDFAFIDADKSSYLKYYEAVLPLLRQGGLIAIDNVAMFGAVVDPGLLDDALRERIDDEQIETIKKLNARILVDERVDVSMLPLADGMTLVLKR